MKQIYKELELEFHQIYEGIHKPEVRWSIIEQFITKTIIKLGEQGLFKEDEE